MIYYYNTLIIISHLIRKIDIFQEISFEILTINKQHLLRTKVPNLRVENLLQS